MAAKALVSLDEYLKTSYSPDREYRDGLLVERNLGEREHSLLQIGFASYLVRRRRQWNIEPYLSLRVRVRHQWYAVPDVCIYGLPGFEGRYPERPPLLWIEILSCDDCMVDVWAKAGELVDNGVPYVWIIDPSTLENELRTPAGIQSVADKTLRIPDSPIMIPLAGLMEE
jgi:Uma2 family endonuclease